MSDDPVGAMDALLDRVVATLSGTSVRRGEPTVGRAEDEWVVATVDPGGRVRDIALDPRLLRAPDRIAPGIVAAVNEAVRAQPQRLPATAMIDELKAIQADSLEMTKQVNASLITTLERLKGG